MCTIYIVGDNKLEMADKDNKASWGPTIISILVGIAVTIGTTWYTIYSSKQEAAEAENERLNKVKDNLVSIIEEHIVNKDSLDLVSFNRLINNRTKEEDLYTRPTIYDLLTDAEYNIQSSKHLSFDKKLEYSKILAALYTELSSDTTINIDNNRFPAEVKQLLSLINETNVTEGKKAISNLITKYEEEIITLEKAQIDDESIIDYLFQSPSRLIIIGSAYIGFLIFSMYHIRIRRKRRALSEVYSERIKLERIKIRDEIEFLSKRINDDSTTLEERKLLEERIEHLFNRMEDAEKYYRQHTI